MMAARLTKIGWTLDWVLKQMLPRSLMSPASLP